MSFRSPSTTFSKDKVHCGMGLEFEPNAAVVNEGYLVVLVGEEPKGVTFDRVDDGCVGERDNGDGVWTGVGFYHEVYAIRDGWTEREVDELWIRGGIGEKADVRRLFPEFPFNLCERVVKLPDEEVREGAKPLTEGQ